MKIPKEIREKKDLKTEGSKARKCSVAGCKADAVRSLSENKYSQYAEKAKLKIVENKLHKIFVCKKHFKEIEKTRKSQEKLYTKKGFLEDQHANKGGKSSRLLE